MLITRVLRGLVVTAAIVMATTIAVHGVRAQEEEGDAAKVKKHAVHASGPVVIAGSPCASPTAGIDCYSITSSAPKDGKVTGTLAGSLLVSTTTSKRGKATCYSVLNASTETVTVGTAVTDLDLSAGNACITTTKKGSTEILTPADAWTTATASPETGKGKETWKVVPTNATSTTSPLAGSGTVTLTGSVSP